MENASKALIIAGAILLSIAIIGIGMAVFNMASQSMSNANMSQQEIDSYNAVFHKYGGVQNGSVVRSLLDTVRTHNLTNSGDNSRIIVVVRFKLDGGLIQRGDAANDNDASAKRIQEIKNGIYNGKKYEVTFRYTTAGYIKAIGISDYSN